MDSASSIVWIIQIGVHWGDFCVSLWMASIFLNVNGCNLWSYHGKSTYQPTKGQVQTRCFAFPPAISLTGNNKLQIWMESHKFSAAANDCSIVSLQTG